MIKTLVKGAMLFTLLGTFTLVGTLLHLCIRRPRPWRKLCVHMTRLFARAGLYALGIKLEVNGEAMPKSNHLIVSNHMSYVDIMVMCAMVPTVFVTSVEMRQTFFLGHLCKIGGCLFVERRNKANIEKEVAAITTVLGHGINVVLFPEGTSTNGTSILPFKRTLFSAAIRANVSVLPVCLRYAVESNVAHALTPAQRDWVCWYGRMAFLPHLLQLVSRRGLRAEVQVLRMVPMFAGITRDELAASTYANISLAYGRDRSRSAFRKHSIFLIPADTSIFSIASDAVPSDTL